MVIAICSEFERLRVRVCMRSGVFRISCGDDCVRGKKGLRAEDVVGFPGWVASLLPLTLPLPFPLVLLLLPLVGNVLLRSSERV